MVNLEDISIQNLYDYLVNGLENNNLLKIIKENNIENYGQLEGLINELRNENDIDLSIFKRFLLNAKDNLEITNKKMTEKQIIYKFDIYNNSQIDNLSLEKTDKETSCKRLIYTNPTGFYAAVRTKNFNCLSVYQAKYLLSRVYVSSVQKGVRNALISNIQHLGNKEVPKIKRAIDYYEEQVIKQAQESGVKDINYFDFNKNEKELIIRDNYKEIIEYIVYNADTCIWGKITERQKRLMLLSISSKGSYQIIKDNFITIFRDYTTLSELEDGKIRPKTLKRFITKELP